MFHSKNDSKMFFLWSGIDLWTNFFSSTVKPQQLFDHGMKMLSYISMTFKREEVPHEQHEMCDICGQNVSGQRFQFPTNSCLFSLQLVSLWLS